MVQVHYYLILAAVMFVVGVFGVIARRNSIVIFMSLELMFNAANLVFVAYASFHHALEGQLFVFFVMAVAAVEVAIGLALIVMIFRTRHSVDVDQVSGLKG